MTSHPTQVVGIIPARYGSTRLPAKPLLDLCGKPMIRHVYERARKSKLLDRLIVATDHPEIEGTVKSFGGEAILTPVSLPSGSDRVAFVAKSWDAGTLFVNIQGDEPLIRPEMIDEAVKPLLSDSSILIGTLATVITNNDDLMNPGTVKVVRDQKGFALYFSRSAIPFVRDGIPRQLDRVPYLKHLGLYVYRKEPLLAFAGLNASPLEQAEKLEQLRFLEQGYKIFVAITTFDSHPIDTEADVEKVRKLLYQNEPI